MWPFDDVGAPEPRDPIHRPDDFDCPDCGGDGWVEDRSDVQDADVDVETGAETYPLVPCETCNPDGDDPPRPEEEEGRQPGPGEPPQHAGQRNP